MMFNRHFRLLSRALGCLAAVLILASLSGCSSTGLMNFFGPSGTAYLNWKGLLVSADTDANQNSPVALDIVFVADPAMLEKLSTLPASRWFAQRQDYVKTYPTAISVYSLELVPGQSRLLPAKELGSPRVAGVLLFADYGTAGEHRLRLPPVPEGAQVLLGERSFTVTEYRL